MRQPLYTILCLLALSGCNGGPTEVEPVATIDPASLRVDGSAFVLKTADGRELRGEALEGAIVHLALTDGALAPVRLERIDRDPEIDGLLRYEFRVPDEAGNWTPACAPNLDGETWGFPLSLPVGHPGREGEITLTCVSGVVGKCVRWGYPPWKKGPGGEDLMPMHAACVRMARADYCGDGDGHTKEGTSIDNYDDLGIQTRGAIDDPSYVFEAGWTADGAVCVAHTRWTDVLTMDALYARCPRLASVPRCDEAAARKLGARLFNASRLKPLTPPEAT